MELAFAKYTFNHRMMEMKFSTKYKNRVRVMRMHIKTYANSDDIYAVALLIADLQNKKLLSVQSVRYYDHIWCEMDV